MLWFARNGRQDAPGREIDGPMAQVILGGLITSVALNLLVVPTLALRFGRFGTSGPDAAADSVGGSALR